MKIGFDAGAGLVGVKCEVSSSSKAESNLEDESLKLFMETDAKRSLPLTFHINMNFLQGQELVTKIENLQDNDQRFVKESRIR